MTILYEDNHVLIVSKDAGEIVQGDKTGDTTLADTAKAYLKEKYNKPGEVFLGLPHRLDRPTSGVVVLARTSKALTRLSQMFRDGKVEKTYHAIVPCIPKQSSLPAARSSQTPHPSPTTDWNRLEHFLTRNEKQNKSYASDRERPGSKRAVMEWREIGKGERYSLIEVHLLTGRHHQIRCQLAAIGLPVKGDLKYGAPRSNPDGSICLHARTVSFEHPVSHQPISVTAPYPSLSLWHELAKENG